jgi:flagellar hook-associated protein 3 FlgL
VASDRARDEARSRAAGVTEVDMAEAATGLALAQRALEAAISAGAQGFRLTLLDKL